jgi:hypothetical protein
MVKILKRIAVGMLGIGYWIQAAGPLSNVSAGVILTTSAGENGNVNGVTVNTGPMTSTGATITSEVVAQDQRAALSAKATANIGVLGAESRFTEFGASNGVSGSEATYLDDNVVFSGPGNGPILVSLNLHFAGSLNSTNSAGASADVIAEIGSSLTRAIVFARDGVPGIVQNNFSGLGAPSTIYNTTLTTLTASVPLNTPVNIFLDLAAGAAGEDFGAHGESLFLDTFGFVTGAPLFNLPDGYTANSETSFIVDNRFVPPGSAVPEPSTLVMVLMLFVMFGFVTLRNRFASKPTACA